MLNQNNSISNLEDEIDLKYYLQVLIKYKAVIGFIVGIAFVVSIIVSLRLPKIYASTASMFPPQNKGSSKFSMSLEGLSGILAVKSPVDLWVGMLKSQTIKDAIIKRFNLLNLFNLESSEDARKILTGMTKIKKSNEGIVLITVESKDPDLSAKLANAFVEELDQLNRKLVMTAGKRVRVFVEDRLKRARMELERAEEKAKVFQEENRAVMLDTQSKMVMGAMGNIKGEFIANKVELKTLLSYATPGNPQVEVLKTRMEEQKKLLRELEDGNHRDSGSHQEDIFIPTARFPELSLQYARLIRNLKTQQGVYELLTEQYEMARIQEAQDTPTVQILDIAAAAEKALESKWKKVIFLYVTISIFFAVSIAFFIEYLNKRIAKEAVYMD